MTWYDMTWYDHQAGAILLPTNQTTARFLLFYEKLVRPDQTGAIQCCDAPISIIMRTRRRRSATTASGYEEPSHA